MFPKLWERAVEYFRQFLLSAFTEASRRADADLSERFESTHRDPRAAAPQVAAPGQQPAVLPFTPQIEPPSAAPKHALPTAPPKGAPAHHQHQHQLPPRRPRGRPRKEPPEC